MALSCHHVIAWKTIKCNEFFSRNNSFAQSLVFLVIFSVLPQASTWRTLCDFYHRKKKSVYFILCGTRTEYWSYYMFIIQKYFSFNGFYPHTKTHTFVYNKGNSVFSFFFLSVFFSFLLLLWARSFGLCEVVLCHLLFFALTQFFFSFCHNVLLHFQVIAFCYFRVDVSQCELIGVHSMIFYLALFLLCGCKPFFTLGFFSCRFQCFEVHI